MSLTQKFAVAALTGILSASVVGLGVAKTAHAAEHAAEKNACKGQNSCKGNGGCKTDKNACKGQNSCKGQGGCATGGSKKQ